MLLGYARRSPLVVTAVVLATIICAKVLTDWIMSDASPRAVVDVVPTIDLYPRVETWPSPPLSVQPDGAGLPTVVMPDTTGMDRIMGPDIMEYERYMWSSDARPPVRPASPAGLVATDVRVSTARPDTVRDRIADWLGVSTRTLEVNVQGEAVPVVISSEWGVARDGTIIEAVPATMDMMSVSGIMLAAFVIGLMPWLLFSWANVHDTWDDGERGSVLFIGFLLTEGVMIGISHLAERPTWETVVMGAVIVLASARKWRSRLLAYAWALFGLSAFRLLGTDILPPYPSLAQIYGPMGVRGLDIVVLLAGQVAFLAWRILRRVRFGSVVHVHQPSYPLVQDVRVVDRR